MADNTLQDANENIRSWDRSSVKTQVFALDLAQSGESELLGLGDSRVVTGTSAGLTTSSTAYSVGDQLGTEITFTSIVRAAKGTVIQSAALVDKSKLVTSVDLFLFNATVSPAADNAANAFSDADILKLIGVIHFTDYFASANNHILLATNLPISVKPTTSTSIFGHLVTRVGHSFFGAVGDLQAALGVLRD